MRTQDKENQSGTISDQNVELVPETEELLKKTVTAERLPLHCRAKRITQGEGPIPPEVIAQMHLEA